MADTYTPDLGQHIDDQGRVTYEFGGHVHAQGLDLDGGTTDTPPADRRVRWLRSSDGAAVAEIFGYQQFESGLIANAVDPDGGIAFSELGALSASHFAYVRASTQSAGNPNSALDTVRANAGPAGAIIITGIGLSNFLQIPLQNLHADLGTATFAGVPAGNATRSAAVPWTNAHTGAAILSVIPSAAYGFTILPRASAVNQIEFIVTNNPVLQDITLSWITLGH
jgi:hypothetical protein